MTVRACRFCENPRSLWRHKFRPEPETCGSYRCRGLLGATKINPASRVLGGRRGGRTSHVRRWGALLEKWMNLGPREALRLAYKDGYHAGYQARPIAQKKAS